MNGSLFEGAAADAEQTENQNIENANNGTTENGDWHWDDGIKGEGPMPKGFNSKTFGTILAQAKAYPDARGKIRELQNQLGAFVGAPEEYTNDFGEEFADIIAEDDVNTHEFINEAKQIAKNLNMTDEGYKQLATAFMKYNSSISKEISDYQQRQLKEIGENPSHQMQEVLTWMKQAYPSVDSEVIKEMMGSAAAVKAFQSMRSQRPMGSIPPTDASQMQSLNRSSLRDMMRDKKYGMDDHYTKMVDGRYREYFGK